MTARTERFDVNLHVFRSLEFRGIVDDAIKFFLQTPVCELPPLVPFIGSGVYSLYYTGDYELYAGIARANRDVCVCPIYMGKTVPPGWRTARAKDSETPDLYQRLRQHARSVQQGANLRPEDFRCRFMVLGGVEGDLVVPVEAELIRRYRPLWNSALDGFGNHDPGAGRYNQARSEWDILHPGRPWAERLTGESPRLEDVLTRVRRFLEESPFP